MMISVVLELVIDSAAVTQVEGRNPRMKYWMPMESVASRIGWVAVVPIGVMAGLSQKCFMRERTVMLSCCGTLQWVRYFLIVS